MPDGLGGFQAQWNDKVPEVLDPSCYVEEDRYKIDELLRQRQVLVWGRDMLLQAVNVWCRLQTPFLLALLRQGKTGLCRRRMVTLRLLGRAWQAQYERGRAPTLPDGEEWSGEPFRLDESPAESGSPGGPNDRISSDSFYQLSFTLLDRKGRFGHVPVHLSPDVTWPVGQLCEKGKHLANVEEPVPSLAELKTLWQAALAEGFSERHPRRLYLQFMRPRLLEAGWPEAELLTWEQRPAGNVPIPHGFIDKLKNWCGGAGADVAESHLPMPSSHRKHAHGRTFDVEAHASEEGGSPATVVGVPAIHLEPERRVAMKWTLILVTPRFEHLTKLLRPGLPPEIEGVPIAMEKVETPEELAAALAGTEGTTIWVFDWERGQAHHHLLERFQEIVAERGTAPRPGAGASPAGQDGTAGLWRGDPIPPLAVIVMGKPGESAVVKAWRVGYPRLKHMFFERMLQNPLTFKMPERWTHLFIEERQLRERVHRLETRPDLVAITGEALTEEAEHGFVTLGHGRMAGFVGDLRRLVAAMRNDWINDWQPPAMDMADRLQQFLKSDNPDWSEVFKIDHRSSGKRDSRAGTSLIPLPSPPPGFKPRHLLIEGPSGAGKTLVARLLKDLLALPEGAPLCPVNASGLSPTLLENELFGTMKGQATEIKANIGLAMSAIGGILFFDEIGDVPLELQPRLLTFLDDLRVMPGGMHEPSPPLPMYVVAATNRHLEELIAQGRFRHDLYHRFRLRIKIPGMEERKEDIPELIDFVLGRPEVNFTLQETPYGRRITHVTPEFVTRMQAMDYSQGHFRQFETLLIEAVAKAAEEYSPVLDVTHLGPASAKGETQNPVAASPNEPLTVALDLRVGTKRFSLPLSSSLPEQFEDADGRSIVRDRRPFARRHPSEPPPEQTPSVLPGKRDSEASKAGRRHSERQMSDRSRSPGPKESSGKHRKAVPRQGAGAKGKKTDREQPGMSARESRKPPVVRPRKQAERARPGGPRKETAVARATADSEFFAFTEAQWQALAPLLPKREGRGHSEADNRRTLAAIFWKLRSGRGWKALPARYGHFLKPYREFCTWRPREWQAIRATFLRSLAPEERKRWERCLPTRAGR